MYAALLTACLFALTGVCATQSSRLLGAGRANVWRLIVALTILGLWAHLFGQGLGGGVVFWFMLAGAVGFGLGGWCMFQALRRIGSTLSLLIVECAATVFALIIGWLWLGASLSGLEMLMVALILSGIVVGMSPGPIPTLNRQVVLVGTALATAAALFQAISFNISRYAYLLLMESEHTLGHLTAAYQRLLGGLVVALVLYGITRLIGMSGQALQSKPHPSPLPAPVWVFLNALFGPVLGVSCMLWAISLVPNPGLAQAIAATATLLSVPFAAWLEKARPQASYYLGCLLALGGTAGLLIQWRG